MPKVSYQTTDFENYIFNLIMGIPVQSFTTRTYSINQRGKFEHSTESPQGLELTLEKYPQVDTSQTMELVAISQKKL